VNVATSRASDVRRALASELIGESARTGRRTDLLTGLLWQTVDLFLDGHRHAERRLAELRNLLAQQPHPLIGNAVKTIDVMLSIRAGHLGQAEVDALACRDRGRRLGDVDAAAVFAGHLSAIRWYQGRIAELVDSPTLRPMANAQRAVFALAAAAAGDQSTAERELSSLRRSALTDGPRSSTWLAAMYGIVEAAYLLNDADTATRAYELLRRYADVPVVSGLAALCLGSVQHTLGVAALSTGQLDQAVTHLRVAVQDNLALRHWPAVVMSRVRYAQALRRRGHAADVSQARNALTAARAEADFLGLPMPRYNERSVSFHREGERWLVRHGGRILVLPSTVGMFHLAVLLANPGREIPAVELVSGLNTLRTAGSSNEQELARLAVSKAIRRAIKAIGQADAQLGAHLGSTVKTGTQCSYRPR
jgi:hypothetical protein